MNHFTQVRGLIVKSGSGNVKVKDMDTNKIWRYKQLSPSVGIGDNVVIIKNKYTGKIKTVVHEDRGTDGVLSTAL